MNFFKKTLPVMVAFVFGCLAIILDYIPHQASESMTTVLTKWLILITAVAAFLGIYSLLQLHFKKIKRQGPGWAYSFLVWLGFLLMISFGIYNNGEWFWNPQVSGKGGVAWLYQYIFTPCQATMFSILAFFIASAAYRTFRAKTIEAGLLLVAAVIMMFGKVPISSVVWDGFPQAAQWLLDFPNMAVKRAIFFGVALGAVSTSLRIIFGIERSYMGGD